MKKIVYLIIVGAVLLMSACTKKSAEAFYPERLAYVDSAYNRYVENGYMPQCVAMVVKDGEVAYLKAFGYRDIEKQIPCETTDIFRMASQTKAIITVAFMTLFEEGKIQLDEPITKYLPEWDNPQILDSYDPATGTFTTHPAKNQLTVRHFITHTSGLCIDGFYDDIAEQLGVPTHMSYDSVPLREAVRALAKMPLKHEPGADFTYACNTNVLGALCEILSGQDIYTFIKERVLDPCEMTDTYFYLPEEKKDRLVTLYTYPKGGPLKRVDGIYQDYPYTGAKVFCSPSAGLCGTIQDYAHFCQMVLDNGMYKGRRVIGRKTLEMMQKNGVGHMRGEIGFGMAWDVFTPENAHNTIVSEGSMRWGGMFGTDYIIDPKENLILLMYVNNMPNLSGYNAKTLLHNTVYQALK